MSRKVIAVLILLSLLATGGGFWYWNEKTTSRKKTSEAEGQIRLSSKWKRSQIQKAIDENLKYGQPQTKTGKAIIEEIDKKQKAYLSDHYQEMWGDETGPTDSDANMELEAGMIREATVIIRDSNGDPIFPSSNTNKKSSLAPVGAKAEEDQGLYFNKSVPSDPVPTNPSTNPPSTIEWRKTLDELHADLVLNYFGVPINPYVISVEFMTSDKMSEEYGSRFNSLYIPSRCLIVVATTKSNGDRVPDLTIEKLFTHEYSHAFRNKAMYSGNNYSWMQVWEEGMAEAAVALLFDNYCTGSFNRLESFNLSFRGDLGKYGNFTDQAGDGCGLWMKLYTEDNNFFRSFHNLLRSESNITSMSSAELRGLTSRAITTIEGKTSKEWLDDNYFLRDDVVAGGATYMYTKNGFLSARDKNDMGEMRVQKDVVSTFGWALSDANGNQFFRGDINSNPVPSGNINDTYAYMRTYKMTYDALLGTSSNPDFNNYTGRIKMEIYPNNDTNQARTQYFIKPPSGTFSAAGLVTGSGDKATVINIDDPSWEQSVDIKNGMFNFTDSHLLGEGRYRIDIYVNSKSNSIANHYFNKTKNDSSSTWYYLARVNTPFASGVSMSVDQPAISEGGSAIVSWVPANINSCQFTDGTPAWQGNVWSGAGSFTAENLSWGVYNFSLDCVDASGGTLKATATLTVSSTAAVVTSFVPDTGRADDVMIIKGENFRDDTVVYFGDPFVASNKLSVRYLNSTTLQVTVPDGSGIVDLYVYNPGSTRSGAPSDPFGTFTYSGSDSGDTVSDGGSCIFNGNNEIHAAMLCLDTFQVANQKDNLDFIGSFVANSFKIKQNSQNIHFNYDFNLGRDWPPGFRYLKMPEAEEK